MSTKLKRNNKKSFIREMTTHWAFYVMALPSLLLVTVFCYFPMAGVVVAFKDYNPVDGIFGSPWTKRIFENFEFFFKSDSAYTTTFNTIFYNIIIAVGITLVAITLSIMLNEVSNKFVTATYKGIILIPTFLSWIVIQYIVFSLLSGDRGIANQVITSMGGDPIQWYSTPSYWRFIMPFAYLWKNVGYYSVLYVASIAGISSEYYEAAELDGASKWKQITQITLPLIKPTIIVLSLLWVGKLFNGGLGDWNAFFTLTNDSGALYPATDVIDTYVYRALKKMNNMGMSSAVGLYQSVIGFILVLTSNTIIKKVDPDSAMF